MNLSPEIFNELKAISPLLVSLEKINVFQVPEGYFHELHLRIADHALFNNTSAVDNINKKSLQQAPAGYFDTLSDSILAKIKAAYPDNAADELQSLSPMLYALKGENVFSVPEGYFESLAVNVVGILNPQPANIESAAEELQTLSPMLYALKGKNIFSVPDGYFESLAVNVAGILNPQPANIESAAEELQTLSPVLYALKSENVFSVPEGYFESLAVNVAKILNPQPANTESAAEELQKLSPVLYALKSESVFSVPGGYFESLAVNVVGMLKPKPAKIITMKRRNSWWKYAAAAVITGVIAISSLQIFNSPSGIKSGKSAIPEYVQNSFQYKTENDLNAGIAKLSDDDIIKYLEKNGNIMDNELLINNTDVDEMPTQADYLTDENTLNTYLDKIDAETVDKPKP